VPDPRDDLYERIREDIASERGALAWIRARPTPLRAALLGALGFGGAVALIAAMRPESFTRPRTLGWAIGLTGAIAMTAVAMAALLRPVHADGWSPLRRRLVGGAIALGALGAITLAGDGSLGALGTGHCLMMGAMASLPTFVAALLLDRHPRRGALFAALSATLVGALTLQVMCRGRSLLHLVTEHFGVVLAGGLFYFSVAALLARVRR